MREVAGKYNTAKIFTDIVDENSLKQIETLCNQEFTSGSKIRLMPDVHSGVGSTIGTTMTLTDKIVPNLVGVDIGCGMETLVIKADSQACETFNPAVLDTIIRKDIPSGFAVRRTLHDFVNQIEWKKIKGTYNKERALRSIGTLGGGNHFIECNRDNDGKLYIVIHSGSRHAGLEIANYYQEQAWKQLNKNADNDCTRLIEELKEKGLQHEIQKKLDSLKNQIITTIPKDLAYTTGQLFDDYINDMRIMQNFAILNRKAMLQIITNGLNIKESEIEEQFTTIHNYIDTENMILRKGAVSAKKGEKLLIPINMRDGSLICIGKGNEDWNYSAPHGAGRIMSRSKAKKTLNINDFKNEMSGIWSSTINIDTLDEAPMAYKNKDSIIENIKPTADIIKIIKPIYNFKAAE